MTMQTAKGVRDIPPEEKILKNRVVVTLQEVFELYGFAPLETPMLERYETLSSKFAAGEASDALKETFKLKDQGDRDLGLRFDLTVPLARFVAMNPNLKMPFKRYEMGTVFRDGPIKLGRYREFWQCDIDVVGSTSMMAEAELLAAAALAFEKLKLKVGIKVNNRKVLNGILEQAGVVDKENAIIAIDKLDKIGKEGVSKDLQERGLAQKQITAVLSLVQGNVTLADLKKKVTNTEALQGIQELEELFGYLKVMGISSVAFEVSLARGLAYYTGTVFEVFLKEGSFSSSLAGGGRYDNMIGKFMGGGREVPAVGIAFGLEPIMDVLKMQEKKLQQSTVEIYVVPIGMTEKALEVAQELRAKGIKVSLAYGKKGVSKNLEYASSLGIPYVVLLGEDEVKKKKVLLRDMSSGEQSLVSVSEAVRKIRG